MSAGLGVFADSRLTAALMAVGQLVVRRIEKFAVHLHIT
jgi:hypothetical protein